jgi:hypothetical protein
MWQSNVILCQYKIPVKPVLNWSNPVHFVASLKVYEFCKLVVVYLRFGVLTKMKVSFVVLWVVTSCGLLDGYERFSEALVAVYCTYDYNL